MGNVYWNLFSADINCRGRLRPSPPAAPRSINATAGPGPDLTEWYLNTALGVEQGFTIARKPEIHGSSYSPIILEIKLSGNVQPVLERYDPSAETGTRLLLQSHTGHTLGRYTSLMAYDADSKRLPARLAL